MDAVDPVHEWLRFGLKQHGRVTIVGFRDMEIPIELNQIFVPLHVYADRAREGRGPDPRATDDKNDRAHKGRAPAPHATDDKPGRDHGGAEISLENALATASDGQTRLALIGDPGAGKTTLLRHLFRRVVVDDDDMTGAVVHLRGLHPVLVRLATVKDDELVPHGLEKIVTRVAAEEGYPKAGAALLARTSQLFLFLLDGLDEVREEI